jgi:hypothetical protein
MGVASPAAVGQAEGMNWNEVPEEGREAVLTILLREAERLEQDAERMEGVARVTGRRSLTETQMSNALAFRAAIDLLGARPR